MEQKRPQLKARVDGDYGEFVLEPLARGYGVTIGNPIRRILMSSIPGTAVTSVYIEDVLHEFSTIPGVREDVIRLILNLKELVVKFHAPGPKTLTLRAQGEGEVRASAFEVPTDAEIVNPDLVIANLAEDGKLVMEVRVEEGEGYVSADKHATKDRINSIPVDAMFSPVRRVAYHVENTRVGQQTDLDRLILRVWTDGEERSRVALLGTLSEYSVVANGPEMWTYSSAEDEAVRYSFSDADLAEIASPWVRYERNAADIRAERPDVDDEQWVVGRLVFIDRLLGRAESFRTPQGRAWESEARRNLARERSALTTRPGSGRSGA